MNNAKVTVVLPTYRRPFMLKRTLISIINQIYNNFIVYVLDNASGDETASLVDSFAKNDSRIKYYCHLENIGIINNCIYGFGMVKTPYFCYLADDDLWLPNFLAEALSKMKLHPEVAFFGGTSICIDMKGNPYLLSGPIPSEGIFFPPEGLIAIWLQGWPQQSAVLYKSEVLKSIGSIAPILGFDLEYLTRIASRFPIYLSSQPLSFFTINQNSLSISRTVETVVKEWQYIKNTIEGEKSLSEQIKERVLHSWKNRFPYQVRMMAMLSLKKGNLEDAKKGLNLLKKHYSFLCSTTIISIACYLAGISTLTLYFVRQLFRWRTIIFTLIRKLLFWWKYHRLQNFWWAKKLTEENYNKYRKAK